MIESCWPDALTLIFLSAYAVLFPDGMSRGDSQGKVPFLQSEIDFHKKIIEWREKIIELREKTIKGQEKTIERREKTIELREKIIELKGEEMRETIEEQRETIKGRQNIIEQQRERIKFLEAYASQKIEHLEGALNSARLSADKLAENKNAPPGPDKSSVARAGVGDKDKDDVAFSSTSDKKDSPASQNSHSSSNAIKEMGKYHGKAKNLICSPLPTTVPTFALAAANQVKLAMTVGDPSITGVDGKRVPVAKAGAGKNTVQSLIKQFEERCGG